MGRGFRRAVRLTLSPNAEWQAIRGEPFDQRSLLVSFVLPLACIPAVSLGLGLAWFGSPAVDGLAQVMHRGAVAYFGLLASTYLLAASMFVLAPLFVPGRSWALAFKLAAYSSAPVMLCGVLLVYPEFAYALILPALHCFYLQYAGAHLILGVKEDQAAEFVALGIVLLTVGSTLLGAFGAWLGIL